MPAPTPVAILGFSAFDRKALASNFALADRALPRYQHVLSVDNARLVIADADDAGVVGLLQTLGRLGDALLIGDQAPDDAGAWLMRPIDQPQVLRELDALLEQRDHPRSVPLPLGLPSSRPMPLGRDTLRTIGTADLADVPARRADDADYPAHHASPWRERHDAQRRQRDAVRRPQIAPRALLVDDSEIALHFLRRQLEGYGLDIDFARDSDRALDLLTQHTYGIAFLDIDLGEDSRVDGLRLCHQIRHQLRHPGGKPPMLVMVSAFHDPVQQVRGTLAGADAMLGKPLDLQALDRLLQRQGLVRHGADAHRSV